MSKKKASKSSGFGGCFHVFSGGYCSDDAMVLLSEILGQNLLDYRAENCFLSAVKSYALIAQEVSV